MHPANLLTRSQTLKLARVFGLKARSSLQAYTRLSEFCDTEAKTQRVWKKRIKLFGKPIATAS